MRGTLKKIGLGIAAVVALIGVVFWLLISSVTLPGEVKLADVRGSGPSFGDRPVEFGREEAEDLDEVAGWIAEQSWSKTIGVMPSVCSTMAISAVWRR